MSQRHSSKLALGHATVESAERKPLLTVRFGPDGYECCPVELSSPVLAIGCALQPDGRAEERRVDATLGEHRHVPGR